jgi:UDP-glucuronate decarboxylase
MKKFGDSRITLVTVGAGFLGSYLIDRLLERGDSVIGLDNLYTGSLRNIAHLDKNPYFRFLDHDITQPIDLKVDEIYNLACPASPVHYQAEPIKTLQTSVYMLIQQILLRNSSNLIKTNRYF